MPFYDRTNLVGETLGTVHHNLLFGALLVVGDRLAVSPKHPMFADRRVHHPAGVAHGLHRAAVDSPPGESHLDGRDRFRHPRGRRGRARRKRPARGAQSAAEAPPGTPSTRHSFRRRRGAPDVLRDGDHHRGAHSGVHAAARGGPHLSAAGAHIQLCPAWCAGVRAHRRPRALRRRSAPEGRRGAGAEAARVDA